MVYYKTEEEVDKIRFSCQLVSQTLGVVGEHLKPGVTGKFIDKIAEEFLMDQKAKPAFKGYNGFPNTLCVSVNEVVVHGIPSDYEFRDGDIVSVDCGSFFNGYFGDAAYTFAIGNVKPEVLELCGVTLASLYRGIAMATAGQRLEDIGFAIQSYTEREHGYGVVRDLVGHGIGKNLHEEPQVPNYGKRGRGMLLKEGLVIAIEPMINMGRKEVKQAPDNWTILTSDKKPSAHYEHTVVVRKQVAEILSTHQFAEEAIKNNPELIAIPKKN
jgi:methionyl aminopeptidase